MILHKVYTAAQKLLLSHEGKTSKQITGKIGEDCAANYLQNYGIRILHRNWRCKHLELDLIGEDAEGIIFIEVKTRKADSMTSPLEGINTKKRNNLIKAAQLWIAAHDAHEKACRFAIVAVSYSASNSYQVEFYDNAFNENSHAF